MGELCVRTNTPLLTTAQLLAGAMEALREQGICDKFQ